MIGTVPFLSQREWHSAKVSKDNVRGQRAFPVGTQGFGIDVSKEETIWDVVLRAA